MCPQDCPTGLGFPSHFAIPEEMKYSRAVASDGRYSARLTCDFHEDAGDGSRTCRKKWDCSNPKKENIKMTSCYICDSIQFNYMCFFLFGGYCTL